MPLSIKQYCNRIICGDTKEVLKQLPDESVDCVVTSPPYWALRDYGVRRQIGLEPTLQEYLAKLCAVFDEIQRVLKRTGTCWVNMGDTYSSSMKGSGGAKEIVGMYARLRQRATLGQQKFESGLPPKTLCQVPARFAIEMTSHGWVLRNEIIWWKPNCMPSPAKDRFTVDYEKLFFFVKSRHYYFEQQFEALRDPERLRRRLINPSSKRKHVCGDKVVSAINPKTAEASRTKVLRVGRNKRCVWRIPTKGYYGNHFATYPLELIETPIKAGCPEGGIVLDPFMGSGTTALVARQLRRKFVGIELNRKYVRLAEERLAQ